MTEGSIYERDGMRAEQRWWCGQARDESRHEGGRPEHGCFSTVVSDGFLSLTDLAHVRAMTGRLVCVGSGVSVGEGVCVRVCACVVGVVDRQPEMPAGVESRSL